MKTSTLLKVYRQFLNQRGVWCNLTVNQAVDHVILTAGHCNTRKQAWQAFCDDEDINVPCPF